MMMKTPGSKIVKIRRFLRVLVVIPIAFGLTACRREDTRRHTDFGSQMIEYTKRGRYDDAVRIGIKALKNEPSDETVYQQIAMVYLVRAGKDKSLRERWVSEAASYTEKASSVNSGDRDVAGVHAFQEALIFESAGDLSTAKTCGYYERAKNLLSDRASSL